MLNLAKVLIMLVRLTAVFSIVLGVLILSGTNTQYIGAHMGLGFFIVLLVIILGILALIRRAVGLGLAGNRLRFSACVRRIEAVPAAVWMALELDPDLAHRHRTGHARYRGSLAWGDPKGGVESALRERRDIGPVIS